MRFSLGFSPCPNDTYIFYALVNQVIDTKGIAFDPYIADVEELNLQAFPERSANVFGEKGAMLRLLILQIFL